MSAFTSKGYHFHSLLHEVHSFVFFTHDFFVCGLGGGGRWRSGWLRHGVTNRKVADIILMAVQWPWCRLSL